MSGFGKITGHALGAGQDLDRLGAIAGADARADAVRGVDRHGEIGAMQFAVVRHHALQPELAGPRLGERDANETAAVLGHEIDRLGCDLGRGHDQIPLVLALGIVGHDDHFAGANIAQDGFDGIKGRFAHGLPVKHPSPLWAMAAAGGRH